MGIDYYSCTVCGEAFPDVVDYGSCGNCEETLCAHCRDRMVEEFGTIGEDHVNSDNYGEDAPRYCTECITETFSIEEKMDRLLSSLTDEEREVLADKLSGKGTA